MKLIFFLLLPLALSAQKKVIPLNGEYLSFPHTLSSNLSYDQAWSNIINAFEQNHIAARLSDKSTGIIVAQLLQAPFTHEDKSGNIDSNAWAVTEKIYDVATNKTYWPEKGDIEWDIKISNDSDRVSIIIKSISILSVTKIYGFYYLPRIPYSKEYTTRSMSTGKFEKMIESAVR